MWYGHRWKEVHDVVRPQVEEGPRCGTATGGSSDPRCGTATRATKKVANSGDGGNVGDSDNSCSSGNLGNLGDFGDFELDQWWRVVHGPAAWFKGKQRPDPRARLTELQERAHSMTVGPRKDTRMKQLNAQMDPSRLPFELPEHMGNAKWWTRCDFAMPVPAVRQRMPHHRTRSHIHGTCP